VIIRTVGIWTIRKRKTNNTFTCQAEQSEAPDCCTW